MDEEEAVDARAISRARTTVSGASQGVERYAVQQCGSAQSVEEVSTVDGVAAVESEVGETRRR